MKVKQLLQQRPVHNAALVREEKNGFARSFVQFHQTEIADRLVRERIQHMAVLEIIS